MLEANLEQILDKPLPYGIKVVAEARAGIASFVSIALHMDSVADGSGGTRDEPIANTSLTKEGHTVIIGSAAISFVREDMRGHHLGMRLWKEAVREVRKRWPDVRYVVFESFLDRDIDEVVNRMRSYGMTRCIGYIEAHPNVITDVATEDERTKAKNDIERQKRITLPINIVEFDLA